MTLLNLQIVNAQKNLERKFKSNLHRRMRSGFCTKRRARFNEIWKSAHFVYRELRGDYPFNMSTSGLTPERVSIALT